MLGDKTIRSRLEGKIVPLHDVWQFPFKGIKYEKRRVTSAKRRVTSAKRRVTSAKRRLTRTKRARV